MTEKMLDRYYDVQKILYVITAVIGVPVNLVAIAILSRGKCGLSACATRYLVAMAAADLLVIISEVMLYHINLHYFPRNFLDITPVCRVVLVLRRAATDSCVWFTVTFTFDRFVAICCQKLRSKYCTGERAAIVLGTTAILLFLRNIPFYFSREPGLVIDSVPWFCVVTYSFYTDPRWVGFDWFDTILTPFLPFGIILLLNALTIRHIILASRVRRGLRLQNKGKHNGDPEIESRRRSVVLLFTLSINFIILWLPYVAEFVYSRLTEAGAQRNTSEIIFYQVGYLLSNFSCCTNTFIYAVTQSKFREQAMSAVKYPITWLCQSLRRHAPCPQPA